MNLAGSGEWNPRGRYAARRSLQFNGKTYAEGEEFPVTNDRRSRVLFERRLIVPINNVAPHLPPPPKKYRVEARSPGWWDVLDEANERVNQKRLRYGEALAMIEEMTDGSAARHQDS